MHSFTVKAMTDWLKLNLICQTAFNNVPVICHIDLYKAKNFRGKDTLAREALMSRMLLLPLLNLK